MGVLAKAEGSGVGAGLSAASPAAASAAAAAQLCAISANFDLLTRMFCSGSCSVGKICMQRKQTDTAANTNRQLQSESVWRSHNTEQSYHSQSPVSHSCTWPRRSQRGPAT